MLLYRIMSFSPLSLSLCDLKRNEVFEIIRLIRQFEYIRSTLCNLKWNVAGLGDPVSRTENA